MMPVFGFGITREEQFSALPSTLPEEIAFLEIPGVMLESGKHYSELKAYPSKLHKALVVRDIVQSHLADSAPFFSLNWKIEFDRKFRSQCECAAALGCRVISAEFNLIRAFANANYRKNLLNILRSIAGILEELNLLMLLPVYFPADGCMESFSEFLKLKKELFYPGFRFLLNYRYQEEGAEKMLEKVVSGMNFERNFWRFSYMPDPETLLSGELLEKMRPLWESTRGRTPVCVCFEPGISVPDQLMINDLSRMLKKYNANSKA